MTRLISVDDVKAFLPIRGGNTSYDAKLLGFIDTVSLHIERECRQSFKKQVRTEFHTSRLCYNSDYDWGGISDSAYRRVVRDQAIVLRASPLDIEAGVKVWYDPDRQFLTEDLLTSEDVFVDPDASLSRLIINHPTIQREYAFKVEYTAGFEEADGSLSAALAAHAPDLKQAAVDAVLHLFNLMTAKADDDEKSKSPKSTAILPPSTLHAISPYRRVLTGRG